MPQSGMFLPNRLAIDANVNRKLDIFRCPMQNTKNAYMTLAGRVNQFLYVEILREEFSIINFTVPWDTGTDL
jgi:hypothetical protein